ncbi:homocysteine S-methyltransferase family protein, partial [Pseudorhodobacter aquimaris]|uniref:homocysteine S-methyltransferase family protein n=1 Tax=Pseudorhodobacter aquimaris TaxID=687412 RepID=UPI0018DE8337
MHIALSPVFQALETSARERIMILDGAMGTQIQSLHLAEEDYAGTASGHVCRHHTDHPQKGNNDLLILTQPKALEEIHFDFAMAGADIVETNTFSATTIAQADYGLQAAVPDLNAEGARIVRRALDRATAIDGKPRYVAGAVGPTNRTASLSPDVS